MTQCITVNADGKEVYRESKPRRFVPRNGYTRGVDGNFYKHLGSPFIISDIERKEALLRFEAYKTEQARLAKEAAEAPPAVPTVEVCSEQPSKIRRIVHLHKKITFKELKSVISWTCCTRSSNRSTFDSVKFNYNILNLPDFEVWNLYKSIEIDHSTNIIRVWYKNPEKGEPDYYVIKAFITDDSTQSSVVA